MLSLNRETHYALAAVVDLARQRPATISAREIAERYRLPRPALTNILSALARKGLVISTRGAKGGYRLARPPDQIRLTELIEAIEGRIKLTACSELGRDGNGTPCDLGDVCPIHDPIGRVHDILRNALNQVTLEQIAWDRVPSSVVLNAHDREV